MPRNKCGCCRNEKKFKKYCDRDEFLVNLSNVYNLKRFKSDNYDPYNAAIMLNLTLLINNASKDNNMNLPPPEGFDVSIPIIGRLPTLPIGKPENVTNIITVPNVENGENVQNGENIEIVFGYIFISHRKKLVYFSPIGTIFKDLFVLDLVARQVAPIKLNNYMPGMLVHLGFYTIYKAFREKLLENIDRILNKHIYQFIISGISLGGALTSLIGLDFAHYNPIIYSYASPSVGNRIFTERYNYLNSPTWRIFNTSDIVPTVPPGVFFGYIYEHVGNPVAFTLSLNTILDNHIKAYNDVIVSKEKPANPNGLCPKIKDCSLISYNPSRIHQRSHGNTM